MNIRDDLKTCLAVAIHKYCGGEIHVNQEDFAAAQNLTIRYSYTKEGSVRVSVFEPQKELREEVERYLQDDQNLHLFVQGARKHGFEEFTAEVEKQSGGKLL